MMNNTAGLTLIEVMIAMVVLSVGLLAVASMQVVAIQVNSSAQQLTRATTLVQDKIEELLALPFTDPSLTDSNDNGCETHTETAPPKGYTLTWCVNDDATGTSKTIDLTATWTKGTESRTFTLSIVRSIFM